MLFRLDDTIAAIASPPGPAPRGIVRLSGPDVVTVVRNVFEGPVTTGTVPWRSEGLIDLGTPHARLPLTAALLLWPTSRSYTGQPLAEFHTLGAPPLLESLLEKLISAGARQAERGEFTMRAFLNGRLDLFQVEAVLGVIEAADHEELAQALSQLGGGLTSCLRDLQRDVIALLGDLEAGLDFVEEDIEFVSNETARRRLCDIVRTLAGLLNDAREQLPAGYRPRVVLAGLPNTGKSTLFNRLAGGSLAIESDHAGTTRDYLTAPVQIGNLTVDLVDTAGWDSADDNLTQQAQQFRGVQIENADAIIWCTAADLPERDRRKDMQLRSELPRGIKILLPTITCADRTTCVSQNDSLRVSAVTGEGIDEMLSRLQSAFCRSSTARIGLLSMTGVRCRDSLQTALHSAKTALDSVEQRSGDEITALELRGVLAELASILGDTCTDDLLDHIFSSFCIGK